MYGAACTVMSAEGPIGHRCFAARAPAPRANNSPRPLCRACLNGVLAATVKGYVGAYEETLIAPEAAALKPGGQNTIAVHCHQTRGGQGVDAGLVEVRPAKRAGTSD